MSKIFEVGKPIPKIWLHMDFDYEDTKKYLHEKVIKNEEELQRLVNKYLQGNNEYEEPKNKERNKPVEEEIELPEEKTTITLEDGRVVDVGKESLEELKQAIKEQQPKKIALASMKALTSSEAMMKELTEKSKEFIKALKKEE